MRTDAERWRDAFEEMYRLSVIPRRSVDRIGRAVADGRDPWPYLDDIEKGLGAMADLAMRMDDQPPACPHCLGTGHALPKPDAEGGGPQPNPTPRVLPTGGLNDSIEREGERR